MKNYLLPSLIAGCLLLSGCWDKITKAPEEPKQEQTVLDVIEEITEILAPEAKTEPTDLSKEIPSQESANTGAESLKEVLEEIQEIFAPESKTGELKSHKLEELAQGTTAEAAFREAIKNGNVLVDFFATWCPPCQAMHPVLDKLAAENAQIKVVKVDVDQFRNIAEHFEVDGGVIKVSGLPTFYLFKDGKLLTSFSGASSYEKLREKVANLFGL